MTPQGCSLSVTEHCGFEPWVVGTKTSEVEPTWILIKVRDHVSLGGFSCRVFQRMNVNKSPCDGFFGQRHIYLCRFFFSRFRARRREGRRDRKLSPMYWFTPQMATMASTETGRKEEPLVSSRTVQTFRRAHL